MVFPDSLMTNDKVKITLILSVLTKQNFLCLFNNKMIYNFIILVAKNNCRSPQKNFPSFGAVVGSRIRDPGWIKIRIRPDPATLSLSIIYFLEDHPVIP